MEDLILQSSNTMEENILAIIEFVKQVEREHGLSDEEIEYKYTRGNCKNLAQLAILDTLVRLFGKIRGASVVKIDEYNISFPHYYLKVETKKGNACFYDILGKKSNQEMINFMKSDYWKKYNLKVAKNLVANKHLQFSYVLDACEQHIKVEGNNIIV